MARAAASKPAKSAAKASSTNYPAISTKAAIALVEEHVVNTAEIKRLEARCKETKTQLVALMNGSPVAYVGARTLSLSDTPAVPETPARTITREMVGQQIPAKPGRSGYQQLKVG